MNFDAQLLPLAISLLAAAWLGVCAWSDLRTRHVSNGLTLSAIPLAILAAWLTRESRGERLFEFAFHLVVMTLPLFPRQWGSRKSFIQSRVRTCRKPVYRKPSPGSWQPGGSAPWTVSNP